VFVVKSSLFLLMRGWWKVEAHSSKQSEWFSKTAASHEVVSLSREKQIKWKAFILLILKKEVCTFDFTGVRGVTDVQVGFPPIQIYHNFSIFDISARFLFFIFLSFSMFFRIFHISIFLHFRFFLHLMIFFMFFIIFIYLHYGDTFNVFHAVQYFYIFWYLLKFLCLSSFLHQRFHAFELSQWCKSRTNQAGLSETCHEAKA